MLVDVNTPTLIYRWYELVPYGDDLELSSVADDEVGIAPEWTEYDFDLDIVIGPEWRTEKSGAGWIFKRTWHEWAIREGIAPWQPFLLKIDAPEYSECWTDCGTEYDVDWSWDLIEVRPLSDEQVLRRWFAWNRWRERYVKRTKAAMVALRNQRYEDLSAMYLNTIRYWAHGCYDDTSPPDGVAVRLCSRHTQVNGYPKCAWPEMAEGRDNGGNWETAFAHLASQTPQINLALTAEKLRELPQRFGG